jgi:hypothetical protein
MKRVSSFFNGVSSSFKGFAYSLEKEYKILIKITKREYNDQRFRNALNYSKVVWGTIKNSANTTVLPDQVTDDSEKTTTNPVELSNAFNHLFLYLPKSANFTRR